MIPIRLTLEGLYSYRERQTVDFTRLTESHLFGIFGATGSGKSSVLEAISFALYGESERLNKGDRRSYNMMNLRANQLYIAFEFDAEGVQYRFEVQGKRNSRRHEDVGTLERRAYRNEGGEWQPLPEASAEPIIGLSYEHFCRTIIIPQGKFQAFLELTETARTRMLMDIFGLDRFELAEKANGLDRQNQQVLIQTEAQLSQYAEVSPEEMAALKTRLQELGKALEGEKTRQKSLQARVAQAEQAREKRLLADRLAAELQALKVQLPEIERREADLEAYETCLRDFKPLFDQRTELLNRLEHIRREKAQNQELLQDGEEKFEKARATFVTIEKEYLQRDLLKQEAEEYELAIEIRKKETSLAGLAARIENGDAHVAAKLKAIQDRKQEIEGTGTRLKTLKIGLPDVQELSLVKAWFDQLAALQREADQQQADAAAIDRELESHLSRREAGLREVGVPASQVQLPGEVVWATVEKMAIAAREAEARAEHDAEQALLLEHIGTLAGALRPGEPCPLCGATDHPVPASTQGVASIQRGLMAMREQARSYRQHMEQALVQLREWLAQEKSILQRKKDRDERLETALSALSQHRAAFVWTRFSPGDSERVNQQFRELASRQLEITQLEDVMEHNRLQLEKDQAELNRFQEAVQKLREEHSALRSAILTEKKRFRVLVQDSLATWSQAQLEEKAREQLAAYHNREKLYLTGQERMRGIETSNNQLRGTLAQLETNQREANRDFEQLRQTLEAEIAQSSFASLEAVRTILALPVDVVSEKKALEGFRVKEKALAQQATAAEAQAALTPFDPEVFEAEKIHLAEAESGVLEKERELGGVQETLSRMETRWEEKKVLLAAYAKLKTRAENLKTMKNLFKGSGFVNYVSTMFLDQLCLAANDRFRRLTRNTLEIRTGANNSLQVCDWLNGGKERSVKTLSGGQAFQAALSLALALADQVQYQARSRQNFFFLDEGFGSQDKNSLAVVMDTLKSLRKENRVVGVISHVEEMQQEITSHIQITLDPERGSLVRTSWE